MAITKAQQYKQMLRDGGVTEDIGFSIVKPSKNGLRPGYRRANYDASGGGLRDSSPGGKGPERQGRDTDFQQRGESKRDYQKTSKQYRDRGTQQVYGAPQKIAEETAAEFKKNLKIKEQQEKERKQRILEEQRRKQQQQLSALGRSTTTRFGNPNITGKFLGEDTSKFKDIETLKSLGAIEEDDEDDAATAKAIGEQNRLEKFLSNIPSTTGIIGSILEEIPGKSLSEMYEDYGKTEKFKSRFPGIDTFEEYQQAVLDGKISAKGGLMGGFTPGGIQTSKDGTTTQLFQGGQDNPPIPPMTTGSVLGSTDFKKAEVDDRTELEKLLAARGDAFRFFADGGMADDDDLVGGIMDLESGRQMYFGGKLVKSIGKGLKSITKGIKKVAKSPIGKAAILGAIGFGIPGTQFGGLFGTATKKGILGKYGLGQTLGIMGKSPQALGGKTPGLGALLQRTLGFVKDKPLTSIFGASILAGLTPQEKQKLLEQEEEEGLDIAAIRGGEPYRLLAEGGKAEPVAKKTMPLLDMNGMEKDYRETGGFVEMGRMERADDVPARLSKNEFVFTADAVRNAGDGNIDKGAEVMYNMMKNLEAGGEVSEESQGLEGARKMFQTSQRLGEVI
mgnify:CR=1 FL=1